MSFYIICFIIGIIGNSLVLIVNLYVERRVYYNQARIGVINLAIANMFHLLSVPLLFGLKWESSSNSGLSPNLIGVNDAVF